MIGENVGTLFSDLALAGNRSRLNLGFASLTDLPRLHACPTSGRVPVTCVPDNRESIPDVNAKLNIDL